MKDLVTTLLQHLDDRVLFGISLVPTGLFIGSTWPAIAESLSWHQQAYGIAALALILMALVTKMVKLRGIVEENRRKQEEHDASMDQHERLKEMPRPDED